LDIGQRLQAPVGGSYWGIFFVIIVEHHSSTKTNPTLFYPDMISMIEVVVAEENINNE
jgi:hypothetical protein